MNKEIETNNFTELPMIATRGMLAFPQMTLSFDVEREASVRAADEAASGDHLIFLSMQKHIEDEAPGSEEVYRIGTVCRVRQLLRQMKGYSRMIVESLYRAEAVMIMERDGMLRARVVECPDLRERISDARRQAVVRSSLELFQEYLGLTNDLPPTHMLQVFSNPSSEYITWFIAQNMQVNPEDKQQILECGYPVRRLMLLNRLLRNEIQVLKIEQELSNQAQEQMMENQREYFLREELRAIQAELGEDDQVDDFSEYAERIRNLVRMRYGKSFRRSSVACVNRLSAHLRRPCCAAILTFAWSCRGEKLPTRCRILRSQGKCWTKITTVWKRSRKEFWNI